MIKFSNVDAFLVRVDSRAPMGLRSAERPHAPGPLSPIFKGGAHARLSRAVILTFKGGASHELSHPVSLPINAFLEP